MCMKPLHAYDLHTSWICLESKKQRVLLDTSMLNILLTHDCSIISRGASVKSVTVDISEGSMVDPVTTPAVDSS